MKLQTKLTLLVAAVALSIGAVSSYLGRSMMRDVIERDLRVEALLAARVLADHITDHLTENDASLAREAARRIVEGTEDAEYVYVVDPERDLVIHTFDGEVPTTLLDAISPPSPTEPSSPRFTRLELGETGVIDVAVPLFEGRLARVHVGLRVDRATSRIDQLTLGIILASLTLALVGIAIGAFVSQRIARPLSELAASLREYASGDLEQGVEVRSGGLEVAAVASAFDQVLEDRKRAREVCREGERFLDDVLGAIQDGISVLDSELNIVRVNAWMAKKFAEYAPLEGKKCYQVYQKEEKACSWCPAIRAMDTGETQRVEHLFTYGMEAPCWINVSAFPIKAEDGTVTGVIEYLKDTTEHRRQERIMAAQVRLSNYATDHSVDEVLQAFLDEAEELTGSEIGFYHFVEKDRETLELHAWSTNTLENLCTAEGRGSRYSIQDAGVWVDCVREGRPVIHNDYASLPHRKGLPEGHAPVVRELVVPVVRGGTIVAILGVGNKPTDYGPEDVETVSELARAAWDVVGRKRAEAEGSRLLTAIDQSTEAVVITDAKGLIQYVNPAFERITGYSRDEVIGRSPSILKSGEHDDAFYAEIWRTINAGESWHGQITNRKKDGTLFVEDATISPVRDASGRTVNHVAVKRDITHEVKLEEQLRQSRKMEAVGQLAGGIAHDFNNLLQAINGYASLALENLDPENPACEYIEEVSRAERRAARQVRQLLAFSRRQVLDMKDVDLNDVVAGVMKMIRRMIGEDITLDIHAGSDLSIVRVDPAQMEQVLLNLAVNARDAMPRGGTITIGTENVVLEEELRGTHPEVEPGPYVLLSVGDTGCGMDSATLANVFEPFFTTKDVDQGTGLGLSTVYGVVQQHKGVILAYSEVGVGTVFEIYLPAVRRSSEVELPAIRERARGGSETILLAEDDEQVLRLAIAILERAGYQVLAAADGEEVLRVFEEHLEEIDLAMLDVVMPKVGGHEVYDRIGARRPDLPFLFASGYSTNSIHTDFVLDEGKRLIQKPYQREDLLRMIRSALDGE